MPAMRTRAPTAADLRRTRLAALAMVFALLAGLAHGWLHDAHAAAKHFADQSEFCAINKVAAVAPAAAALPPPATTDVVYRRPAEAGFVSLHRAHAQPRAPPSPTV